MLQTLGISHPRYDALRKRAAAAFAAIIVIGNVSFPLAVLTGVVK
jgi:succinate dehydrogenase / fumarate reductase cytochrome b subunit